MRFSFQNLILLHGRQQATMKSFVFLVLVSGLLAGCAIGPVFSPDVPLQKRESTNSLDASQIKRMVQSRIDPDDFDYPFDDWLSLDVRGTMLFVNGVINSDSYEEIYYILRENPQVNTLVLTNIPGSMDDETNLALGLELHRANVTMYLPKDAEIASGAQICSWLAHAELWSEVHSLAFTVGVLDCHFSVQQLMNCLEIIQIMSCFLITIVI